MHVLKIQVKRRTEQKDLEYVQKHIDLGWQADSKFNLGCEVYFVNLVWEQDELPKYPPESQSHKS